MRDDSIARARVSAGTSPILLTQVFTTRSPLATALVDPLGAVGSSLCGDSGRSPASQAGNNGSIVLTLPTERDLTGSLFKQVLVGPVVLTPRRGVIVLQGMLHTSAIPHLRQEVLTQDVRVNRLRNPGNGGVPLIQERVKSPIIDTFNHIDMPRSVVRTKLLIGPIVRMDDQQELTTPDRAILRLFFGRGPAKLFLNPLLVSSVPIRCSAKGLRKFRIKAPILLTRNRQGTHSRIDLSWGLNPLPHPIAPSRSCHYGIGKAATPLGVSGNGFQRLKLYLRSFGGLPFATLMPPSSRGGVKVSVRVTVIPPPPRRPPPRPDEEEESDSLESGSSEG